METNNRDYNSISPSAKSLLLMKGMTSIPYARQTAALLAGTGGHIPAMDPQSPAFWGRLVHFESRYQSIDQLLEDTGATNILEISSGFSFRGLDKVQHSRCHYIDTDLPGMTAIKRQLLEEMQPGKHETPGRLEILPLNAMDEAAFGAVTARFDNGRLAIVNEGLLMYLGEQEKKQLCKTILGELKKRGGCWITADIYIRKGIEESNSGNNDELSHFFEQHHIFDYMFESFEAARAFFTEQGFAVDKEAVTDYARLSSLTLLKEHVTGEMLLKMREMPKSQATWRLIPA